MQQLTIGHYQVREELGRGLFSVTCRGVHVRDPGQQVALKIVHPVLAADPAFRAGLERASFALRSLIHPGVACFLTLGAGEQHLAVVRELVAGEPASALIARGPQPVEGTVHLLEQALAALAAIHAFGLAHGDLKPGDFFLCSDGRVRVTDPGLGVLARAALTGANGLPPAPLGHLAPEGPGAQGPRADLYALGLIAWELLVGHAACPSDEPVAMLGWHRYQGLTDPRHERADCPPWLASVLLQLAAMDPERRPGDATQAFELLRRTRAAAPVSVLATPPAPRR
ncbi:MAG: protein kinase, partial [Pseudomonadota bacterium]